jgi:hypothetical protein
VASRGKSSSKRTKTTKQRQGGSRGKNFARANGRSSAKARFASASGKIKEPKPPMPEQHQKKPGLESRVTPRPRYKAPLYKGAGKLDGKVALITGGDSGIGRAVAVLFAREGADVAITHLAEERTDAQESKEAIEAEGQEGLLIEGDVRKPEFCRRAVERTVKDFGKLDILVNNAAFQQHQKDVEDISEEQWDHTFKTNIALPPVRFGRH